MLHLRNDTDMNQTASYFGDSVLSHRQIYKVVDNVFGTISIVSQEGPKLSHEQLVNELASDPLLNQFMFKQLNKMPRVTFSPISRVIREDGSEFSTDTASVPLTPVARLRLSRVPSKSALKHASNGHEAASRQITRSAYHTRRH